MPAQNASLGGAHGVGKGSVHYLRRKEPLGSGSAYAALLTLPVAAPRSTSSTSIMNRESGGIAALFGGGVLQRNT